MKIHELKTDSEVFYDVRNRLKNFEIRKNDRDFKPGDYLHLRRTVNTGAEIKQGKPLVYDPEGEMLVRVTYVLKGPIYGLADGWCIMSIDPCEW